MRKQEDAEEECEITIQFLRLVNESRGTEDLVRAATAFFKQQSGCEAVGIRLKEGEDYPYYETRGFPPEFVETENSLCAKDSAACIIRDREGNPIIECMCGNVICGRFDPGKQFFTKHGSFWTNSTTELLADTTEEDRMARTRNRCNGEGYESVALLPLRVGSQRLGLLQLNDRRMGIFSVELIGLWERLADQLAVALAKFRTEDALRESEERYRSLFENMVEGYAYCKMIFDGDRPRDFIYLAVNHAFEKLTGLKSVVGKKVSEVVPGIREYDPELFTIYGRVALTGKPEQFEIYVASMAAWFHISVFSPKKDHFVAVFDVITERKRTEQTLCESEKRYKDLFDSTLDGIFQVDAEGAFIMMNPAGARIFGYDGPAEMLGKSVLDFWRDPRDRERYIAELKAKNTVSAYPMRARKKNGAPLELEASSRIVEDEKGNVLRIEGILRDVTARERAEELHRESESKFSALAEQSLVGIYIIQKQRFVYVNGRFDEIFGYGPGEIVDHLDPKDLVVPEDRYLVDYNIDRRSSGRVEAIHYEFRGLRKTGEIITVEVYGSRAFYQGNAAIVGTILDISEKKKLERQLLQAQKMEAIGQLTSGIAHDFNNILSAIIGYGALLQMKLAEDDPRRTYVNEILAGTDRAANLTRSLLTFSRKQIGSMAPIDVHEIIRRVGKLLHGIIGEDIDLRLSLADREFMVSADAGQIEQVLMNLATNARDAMPEGGTLFIETGLAPASDTCSVVPSRSESAPCVVVTVSDTGIGMDEKTREKIFEPFFTTKELGRGTGLGLAMVYGIIKQHGGRIHCYSEPGKGTTFRVYLPLLLHGRDKKTQPSPEPASEEPKRGTETILVAEDDGSLRRLVISSLEDFGYTVIEAVDGEDAVKKFQGQKDRIDLLLCDVIMPKKSGREVREEIEKTAPGLKSVFMSGYPADMLHQKNLLAAGVEIVTKPISPSVLLKKVRAVLDKG